MDENVLSLLFSLPFEAIKHSYNVAIICQQVAEQLQMDKRLLFTCGLFHDIGKVNVPFQILTKRGCLTKHEFEIVKQHTMYGYDILKEAGIHEMVCQAALYHHERLNGMGYWRKKGNEIPLIAQIVAVEDVFDAVTSYRTYRFPKSKKVALRILQTPKLFNQEVVKVLENI